MSVDNSKWQPLEELHTLLLREVQTLRGSLSRLEQLEQERRHAEEAHRQEVQYLNEQEKLAAIARFTGGIAHHFNNLLTIILGYGEVLLAQFPPDNPLRESAVAITGAGERAAGLVRQLMLFSRQSPPVTMPLNLNTVLASLTPALRHLLGPDIELTCSLGPGLGMVRADPGQVGTLLLALTENARDAMPQGGKLTIRTGNVNPEAQRSKASNSPPPGPSVFLEVSDTGQGMDRATRARLFEPFFTTKEVGDRAGLGLATVYGIVRQSGGRIEVRSEPGQGSTFTAYLPRCEDAGEGQAAAVSV